MARKSKRRYRRNAGQIDKKFLLIGAVGLGLVMVGVGVAMAQSEPEEKWTDPLAAQVAALARQRVWANDTIRTFQAREGLKADGLYGVKTSLALAKYGGPVPVPYVGSRTAPVPVDASAKPKQIEAARQSAGLIVQPTFLEQPLPAPAPTTEEAGAGVGPTGIPYGKSVSTWSVWDPSTWTKQQYDRVEKTLLGMSAIAAGIATGGAAALATTGGVAKSVVIPAAALYVDISSAG